MLFTAITKLYNQITQMAEVFRMSDNIAKIRLWFASFLVWVVCVFMYYSPATHYFFHGSNPLGLFMSIGIVILFFGIAVCSALVLDRFYGN